MDIVFGVIVGLLVLMLLVTAHEFGHFIMARRNGVRVLEFGIGFPSRAVAWVKDPKTKKWRKLQKSEWGKPQEGLVFSLNWLPIGGFCQMDGESAEDDRPGTFGHANFWQKTKILFGGVAMNWLVGFVILTILAWTGMPTFLNDQFTVEADTRREGGGIMVTEVLENSPAEAAGIQVNDRIIAVNGELVTRGSEITSFNDEHAGEEVSYRVGRVEKQCTGEDEAKICTDEEFPYELTVTLNSDDSEPKLGIRMGQMRETSYSTWSAPIVGAGLTLQTTAETFHGLGDLLWNLITGTGKLFSFDANVRESGQEAIAEAGNSVSGPVGIIKTLYLSSNDFGKLMLLAAIISISLACMNVLPIPALDGGRWLIIGIYKLRKKKLTKETEQKIVARSMLVLFALMILVTILDITRFFQ